MNYRNFIKNSYQNRLKELKISYIIFIFNINKNNIIILFSNTLK